MVLDFYAGGTGESPENEEQREYELDGKDEENKEEDHISIMTDPELHPLPISPNDPL